MFKKSFYALSILALLASQTAFAITAQETSRHLNPNSPSVTSVGSKSADISLSPAVLSGMSDEEKSRVYFEYIEKDLVCIAIYPTPEACLPKKTEAGKTAVTITNLKPETTYTVKYKLDNTIRCITTPCPENGFESSSVEFKTMKLSPGDIAMSSPTDNVVITSNLFLGSRGAQVITLQTVLIQKGYMTGSPTGYFGVLTFKAVKDLQKAHGIIPTGFVGSLTRAVLSKMTVSPTSSTLGAEKFEGKVTAYSTQCFVDGECSITVDGKKVVTTTGWSQMIVGQVRGIPDFGSIENHVGAHAKVYAKKTDAGYTLYGNADYYIEITPKASSKLPDGSAPVANPSAVKGHTWVWQKTVMADNTVVIPKKAGAFTINFGDVENLSGKTDCNGFFGSYMFGTDGFIKFGPLGSTLMFCEGSQEGVFTGYIAKSDRYTIDSNGNLILLLAGNEGQVYFTKK